MGRGAHHSVVGPAEAVELCGDLYRGVDEGHDDVDSPVVADAAQVVHQRRVVPAQPWEDFGYFGERDLAVKLVAVKFPAETEPGGRGEEHTSDRNALGSP